MKKTIAFVLFAALLISAVIPVNIFAEEPKDYADNLVAYWDFESSKPLNDKGTGSTEANTLTAQGNATYANGVATIGTTASDFFQINSQTGKDVGQSQALTLGFKVNLTYESTTANTFLISKTNGFSVFATTTSDKTGYELFWANDALHTNAICKYDIFGDTVLSYGQEYYIFIVVEAKVVTAGTPVNDITGYYSTDGQTFTAAETLENTTHAYVTGANRVCEDGYVFGSYANKANFYLGSSKKGASIKFDDVWYFNTAVSADSLSTIALHRMHGAGNTAADAPAYRGCQVSAVASGKFSTRFVGTVDSTAYAEVGFEITVTNYNGASGQMKVYDTNTVYSSIVGSTEVGGSVTYTAEDLGGTYIFALSVNNIPTDKAVEFLITPYYIAVGGTERVPGAEYTVTVFNGNVVSQTAN